MKIYVINHYTGAEHEIEPRFVTNEYHVLIMYVRKHTLSENKIYELTNNDFDAGAREISKEVYENAYNNFSHYTDPL